MSVKTALTRKPLPDAVEDLRRQAGNCDPRLIFVFAATAYDPDCLSKQMGLSFPDAKVVGCSTAGEIAGGSMTTGSVAAIFLDDDVIDNVAVAVVPNISHGIDLTPAFDAFTTHFGVDVARMPIDEYVGVVLVDGLSGAEECLMEKLGDRTDLLFVGGSAGDDLKFNRTCVIAKGAPHADSAVLILIRPRNGFGIIKTQSFKPTGLTLTPTEVDEPSRRVISFDGKPAARAYAEALGIDIDQLASRFMKNPLAIMVDSEPYVRSPQRIDNTDVMFYCRIKAGMPLSIVEATDIVDDTRAAIAAYQAQRGPVNALIDFHCILRSLQLRDEKRCEAYAAIFDGLQAVGFSTYGEAYIGHVNQTSTMLALH